MVYEKLPNMKHGEKQNFVFDFMSDGKSLRESQGILYFSLVSSFSGSIRVLAPVLTRPPTALPTAVPTAPPIGPPIAAQKSVPAAFDQFFHMQF